MADRILVDAGYEEIRVHDVSEEYVKANPDDKRVYSLCASGKSNWLENRIAVTDVIAYVVVAEKDLDLTNAFDENGIIDLLDDDDLGIEDDE